ncbi:N-acetylglucosamine kinase [Streptomyces sp. NPDC006879]|uniref:N-acetylglucosamine kinase n=1 Tax=Streptomyces sp. NPDC006879 TaxID=3364767 RepID=UPI0036A7F707
MGLTVRENSPVTVLAIDAGNSKTDVALLGGDGQVLGAARAGGFQPPRIGVAAAVDLLEKAVRDAAADAGLGRLPKARHLSACLANVDLPVEERQLTEALEERGWAEAVDVRNDTFALLRAGVEEPRGVAVVCGAGVNCCGMQPDGRTARFPALGKLSGDWGGGAGLAEEALWYAARAEDGRGADTELARALPAHFALDSVYALIEAFHLGRIPPGRRHELTPVLFAVSAAGDPVAHSLVERMADEVVALAVVALRRLGLLTVPAPVVLGGSVLAAEHPQLNGRVERLLAEQAPLAQPSVVTAPPVLGAALLGLDALNADRAAHRRVRRHYGG